MTAQAAQTEPTQAPDLLYSEAEEDLRAAVRSCSRTGPTRRR